MIKRFTTATLLALGWGIGAFAASGTVALVSSSSGDLTLAAALANADATVADLTDNSITSLQVTGDGRILFDTDISAYTGTISCASGATAVLTANGGLGADSGVVYVADGGALILDATGFAAGTYSLTKGVIHLAGSGPDGAGALVGKADSNQRQGMWGGSYVLDADALISTKVSNKAVIDFPKQLLSSTAVCNMDMNGHTLTLTPSGNYLPVRMVMDNPGNIVVTNGNLSVNYQNVFNGDASNTFTVSDNGVVNMIQMADAGSAPWTFVHDTTYPLRMEQYGGHWDGPMSLLRDLTVEFETFYRQANSSYDNPPFHMYGAISGDARVIAKSGSPSKHSGHLYLYATNSTFTGGVLMLPSTYLHVMADGAVPASGGHIVMSNACLDVQSDHCTLPPIDFYCSTSVTFEAGMVIDGRIAGALTKSGSDELTMKLKLAAGSIDLQAGTLRLANSLVPWYAGVFEGDYSTGNWSNLSQTAPRANGLFDSSVLYTNSVQYSLRWTTSSGNFSGGAGCSTYVGCFYCPEAGTWRFASNSKTVGKLFIDGSDVCGRQGQYCIYFGNTTLSQGWHSLQYRIGRTGAAYGPNTTVSKAFEKGTQITDVSSSTLSAWASSGLGLAVCTNSTKAADETIDVADFEAFPVDPGDGSVLRLVKPGSAEEADMASAYAAARTVASLTAATNTVLDLCGASFTAGCVTGFPTVVSSVTPEWLEGEVRTMTVVTNWTASAEGLAAGASFSVTDAALVFSDDATMTVSDSRSLPDTHGNSLVVATAAGGITGVPDLVFDEGDRRGVLALSSDGKSLLLAVTSGMMVIIR